MDSPVHSGIRRPNPDEWKLVVEEFEASDLTQKEFADRHQVSLGGFQYWLYKKFRSTLVWRSETAGRPRAAFLPVEVVAPPRAASARRAHARGGAAARAAPGCPEGTQAESLAHLVAVLG
ncbi:IS66 family insertion sequence element accessory protein TnpA [Myxococcus fulvus]|uniref:IS66 family insertion sequence element accessory protein TnpA n=1 Tax=Myxococcus fulvus TaxID=33 RepID=UPI003B9A176D